MATSGPGATNLVTGIADAKLDSIPLIAITGQVPQAVIGTDAFQETPMVEVCRAITKHHYMITSIRDVSADSEGIIPHRVNRTTRSRADRLSQRCPARDDAVE